jgi:hypothetical protein
MCASHIGGAAQGPMVPAEYSIASVGVLLPILSLSFFPSLPGIAVRRTACQAIHAEVMLAALPPALRVLPFSMDHRIKVRW